MDQEQNKGATATRSVQITDAEIQACVKHLEAVAVILAPYAVALTTAQRRRTTRYRKESNTAIPILARLAAASGLSSSALDVEAMQGQADLVSKLQPLHTAAKTLCDSIGDTVLSAKGNAWHMAVTLHQALLRVATRNLELRRDMEAVRGAFSNRKRAASEPVAPSPAAEPSKAALPATE